MLQNMELFNANDKNINYKNKVNYNAFLKKSILTSLVEIYISVIEESLKLHPKSLEEHQETIKTAAMKVKNGASHRPKSELKQNLLDLIKAYVRLAEYYLFIEFDLQEVKKTLKICYKIMTFDFKEATKRAKNRVGFVYGDQKYAPDSDFGPIKLLIKELQGVTIMVEILFRTSHEDIGINLRSRHKTNKFVFIQKFVKKLLEKENRNSEQKGIQKVKSLLYDKRGVVKTDIFFRKANFDDQVLDLFSAFDLIWPTCDKEISLLSKNRAMLTVILLTMLHRNCNRYVRRLLKICLNGVIKDLDYSLMELVKSQGEPWGGREVEEAEKMAKNGENSKKSKSQKSSPKPRSEGKERAKGRNKLTSLVIQFRRIGVSSKERNVVLSCLSSFFLTQIFITFRLDWVVRYKNNVSELIRVIKMLNFENKILGFLGNFEADLVKAVTALEDQGSEKNKGKAKGGPKKDKKGSKKKNLKKRAQSARRLKRRPNSSFRQPNQTFYYTRPGGMEGMIGLSSNAPKNQKNENSKNEVLGRKFSFTANMLGKNLAPRASLHISNIISNKNPRDFSGNYKIYKKRQERKKLIAQDFSLEAYTNAESQRQQRDSVSSSRWQSSFKNARKSKIEKRANLSFRRSKFDPEEALAAAERHAGLTSISRLIKPPNKEREMVKEVGSISLDKKHLMTTYGRQMSAEMTKGSSRNLRKSRSKAEWGLNVFDGKKFDFRSERRIQPFKVISGGQDSLGYRISHNFMNLIQEESEDSDLGKGDTEDPGQYFLQIISNFIAKRSPSGSPKRIGGKNGAKSVENQSKIDKIFGTKIRQKSTKNLGKSNNYIQEQVSRLKDPHKMKQFVREAKFGSSKERQKSLEKLISKTGKGFKATIQRYRQDWRDLKYGVERAERLGMKFIKSSISTHQIGKTLKEEPKNLLIQRPKVQEKAKKKRYGDINTRNLGQKIKMKLVKRMDRVKEASSLAPSEAVSGSRRGLKRHKSSRIGKRRESQIRRKQVKNGRSGSVGGKGGRSKRRRRESRLLAFDSPRKYRKTQNEDEFSISPQRVRRPKNEVENEISDNVEVVRGQHSPISRSGSPAKKSLFSRRTGESQASREAVSLERTTSGLSRKHKRSLTPIKQQKIHKSQKTIKSKKSLKSAKQRVKRALKTARSIKKSQKMHRDQQSPSNTLKATKNSSNEHNTASLNSGSNTLKTRFLRKSNTYYDVEREINAQKVQEKFKARKSAMKDTSRYQGNNTPSNAPSQSKPSKFWSLNFDGSQKMQISKKREKGFLGGPGAQNRKMQAAQDKLSLINVIDSQASSTQDNIMSPLKKSSKNVFFEKRQLIRDNRRRASHLYRNQPVSFKAALVNATNMPRNQNLAQTQKNSKKRELTRQDSPDLVQRYSRNANSPSHPRGIIPEVVIQAANNQDYLSQKESIFGDSVFDGSQPMPSFKQRADLRRGSVRFDPAAFLKNPTVARSRKRSSVFLPNTKDQRGVGFSAFSKHFMEQQEKARRAVGGVFGDGIMDGVIESVDDRSGSEDESADEKELGKDKFKNTPSIYNKDEDDNDSSSNSSHGNKLIRETQNIKNGIYMLEWSLRLMKEKRRRVILYWIYANTMRDNQRIMVVNRYLRSNKFVNSIFKKSRFSRYNSITTSSQKSTLTKPEKRRNTVLFSGSPTRKIKKRAVRGSTLLGIPWQKNRDDFFLAKNRLSSFKIMEEFDLIPEGIKAEFVRKISRIKLCVVDCNRQDHYFEVTTKLMDDLLKQESFFIDLNIRAVGETLEQGLWVRKRLSSQMLRLSGGMMKPWVILEDALQEKIDFIKFKQRMKALDSNASKRGFRTGAKPYELDPMSPEIQDIEISRNSENEAEEVSDNYMAIQGISELVATIDGMKKIGLTLQKIRLFLNQNYVLLHDQVGVKLHKRTEEMNQIARLRLFLVKKFVLVRKRILRGEADDLVWGSQDRVLLAFLGAFRAFDQDRDDEFLVEEGDVFEDVELVPEPPEQVEVPQKVEEVRRRPYGGVRRGFLSKTSLQFSQFGLSNIEAKSDFEPSPKPTGRFHSLKTTEVDQKSFENRFIEFMQNEQKLKTKRKRRPKTVTERLFGNIFTPKASKPAPKIKIITPSQQPKTSMNTVLKAFIKFKKSAKPYHGWKYAKYTKLESLFFLQRVKMKIFQITIKHKQNYWLCHLMLNPKSKKSSDIFSKQDSENALEAFMIVFVFYCRAGGQSFTVNLSLSDLPGYLSFNRRHQVMGFLGAILGNGMIDSRLRRNIEKILRIKLRMEIETHGSKVTKRKLKCTQTYAMPLLESIKKISQATSSKMSLGDSDSNSRRTISSKGPKKREVSLSFDKKSSTNSKKRFFRKTGNIFRAMARGYRRRNTNRIGFGAVKGANKSSNVNKFTRKSSLQIPSIVDIIMNFSPKERQVSRFKKESLVRVAKGDFRINDLQKKFRRFPDEALVRRIELELKAPLGKLTHQQIVGDKLVYIAEELNFPYLRPKMTEIIYLSLSENPKLDSVNFKIKLEHGYNNKVCNPKCTVFAYNFSSRRKDKFEFFKGDAERLFPLFYGSGDPQYRRSVLKFFIQRKRKDIMQRSILHSRKKQPFEITFYGSDANSIFTSLVFDIPNNYFRYLSQNNFFFTTVIKNIGRALVECSSLHNMSHPVKKKLMVLQLKIKARCARNRFYKVVLSHQDVLGVLGKDIRKMVNDERELISTLTELTQKMMLADFTTYKRLIIDLSVHGELPFLGGGHDVNISSQSRTESLSKISSIREESMGDRGGVVGYAIPQTLKNSVRLLNSGFDHKVDFLSEALHGSLDLFLSVQTNLVCPFCKFVVKVEQQYAIITFYDSEISSDIILKIYFPRTKRVLVTVFHKEEMSKCRPYMEKVVKNKVGILRFERQVAMNKMGYQGAYKDVKPDLRNAVNFDKGFKYPALHKRVDIIKTNAAKSSGRYGSMRGSLKPVGKRSRFGSADKVKSEVKRSDSVKFPTTPNSRNNSARSRPKGRGSVRQSQFYNRLQIQRTQTPNLNKRCTLDPSKFKAMSPDLKANKPFFGGFEDTQHERQSIISLKSTSAVINRKTKKKSNKFFSRIYAEYCTNALEYFDRNMRTKAASFDNLLKTSLRSLTWGTNQTAPELPNKPQKGAPGLSKFNSFNNQSQKKFFERKSTFSGFYKRAHERLLAGVGEKAEILKHFYKLFYWENMVSVIKIENRSRSKKILRIGEASSIVREEVFFKEFIIHRDIYSLEITIANEKAKDFVLEQFGNFPLKNLHGIFFFLKLKNHTQAIEINDKINLLTAIEMIEHDKFSLLKNLKNLENLTKRDAIININSIRKIGRIMFKQIKTSLMTQLYSMPSVLKMVRPELKRVEFAHPARRRLTKKLKTNIFKHQYRPPVTHLTGSIKQLINPKISKYLRLHSRICASQQIKDTDEFVLLYKARFCFQPLSLVWLLYNLKAEEVLCLIYCVENQRFCKFVYGLKEVEVYLPMVRVGLENKLFFQEGRRVFKALKNLLLVRYCQSDGFGMN